MNFAGRMQFRRFMCLVVRQNFAECCEKALNKQINLELKASHDYLAMAYHFDRSDVALPGASKFFKAASDEERSHATMIMTYMNKRGGQIILEEVPTPKPSYENTKEAVMEAITMEKTVNEALLEVHAIASQENDPNLCDFIESNFLQEQVDAMKELGDYLRKIERCENDLGSYIFDVSAFDKSGMHK